MFGLLIFLFTVLPALELYLLFKVGSEIGGLNTIFIILLTGISGAFLAKSQGLITLIRVQKTLASGKIPTSEIAGGLSILCGGALLLTPGLITDILGFLMILPGTRSLFVKLIFYILKEANKSKSFNFHVFTKSHDMNTKHDYRFSEESIGKEKLFSQQTQNNVIEGEVIKKDEKDI